VPAVRAGRQVLRIRRNGWLIADCLSPAEVGTYVDLADLCEVIVIHRVPEEPAGVVES
jgi:hypothetical protein